MKLKLTIEGMHCNGCKMSLENELNDLDNVISAEVNLEGKYALVEVKERNIKELENVVKDCGFKCTKVEEI